MSVLTDNDGLVISQSRVFAFVNEIKGPEWYEHKTYQPDWHPPKDYYIIKKVGRGKYSTVYKCAYKKEKFVAIKILVPLDPKRYLREIKILSNLRGGPNIVELLDLIKDPVSDTFSFVMEWVEFSDWRSIYTGLSLAQIKVVMRRVLKALLFSHANGVMHRDIKPQNIAIDPKTLKVRLLDWGLADFYLPRQRYSSHVATRMFKPPELLIEYPYYDYSIDMWSLGLTFAIMLFGRSPIQCGDNDEQQLQNVADFVGGKAIVEYAESLNVKLESAKRTDLMRRGRRGIQFYVEKMQKEKYPQDAIDLLSKLMTVDHRKRVTAKEAMNHPFFNGVEE